MIVDVQFRFQCPFNIRFNAISRRKQNVKSKSNFWPGTVKTFKTFASFWLDFCVVRAQWSVRFLRYNSLVPTPRETYTRRRFSSHPYEDITFIIVDMLFTTRKHNTSRIIYSTGQKHNENHRCRWWWFSRAIMGRNYIFDNSR